MTPIQRGFEERAGGGVTTTSRLLGLLVHYASGAKHATEIGVANPFTTYALLHALEEMGEGRLVSIDINNHFPGAIDEVRKACEESPFEVSFEFRQADSAAIDIDPTDFLFIDSLHERGHLLKELDRHSPRTSWRIAFHDTEEPCNLLPVVKEWLATELGQEWAILAHYRMSHGLTVLERREDR